MYEISYKTSKDAKPLRMMFDKIDGFIKIHKKNRFLVLVDYGRFHEIWDNIEYLVSKKKWYYR